MTGFMKRSKACGTETQGRHVGPLKKLDMQQNTHIRLIDERQNMHIRMLDGPIGIDMGDQGAVSLVYFFCCFSSSLYSRTYGHG